MEGQSDTLFYEAKRSTERQRREKRFNGLSAVGEEDDASETSADPLSGGNYGDRHTHGNAAGFGSRLQSPMHAGDQFAYDRNNGAVSGLSFYDPDALPPNGDGPSPAALQSYYEQGYDPQRTPRPGVPMIQVQRASAAMHPATPCRTEDTDRSGKLPTTASTVRLTTSLAPSTTQAEARIQLRAATGTRPRVPVGLWLELRLYSHAHPGASEHATQHDSAGAGGGIARGGVNIAADNAVKSAGARYHDRFKTPSPPQATSQFNDAMVPSASEQSLGVGSVATRTGGGHSHEHSGASHVSWHTAQGSEHNGADPLQRQHERMASDASKFTAL